MKVGDVVTVRSLRVRQETAKAKLVLELSYKAPKGEMFVVLFLGIEKPDEPLDVLGVMKDMGWQRDE